MQALLLFLCGVLGVTIHCVLKCNSLLNDARAANIEFKWVRDYMGKDYLGIILSLLALVVWYLIFAEVVASYPKLSAFTRISYVTIGWFGSYIIQTIASRAKRKIRAVVDEKTNIADGTDQNITKL